MRTQITGWQAGCLDVLPAIVLMCCHLTAYVTGVKHLSSGSPKQLKQHHCLRSCPMGMPCLVDDRAPVYVLLALCMPNLWWRLTLMSVLNGRMIHYHHWCLLKGKVQLTGLTLPILYHDECCNMRCALAYCGSITWTTGALITSCQTDRAIARHPNRMFMCCSESFKFLLPCLVNCVWCVLDQICLCG